MNNYASFILGLTLSINFVSHGIQYFVSKNNGNKDISTTISSVKNNETTITCSTDNVKNTNSDNIFDNFPGGSESFGTIVTTIDSNFLDTIDFVTLNNIIVPKPSTVKYDKNVVERADPTAGGIAEINIVEPEVIPDYYVSAFGDNTTGTSEGTAWNTMADLYANLGVVPEGSIIGFNRGEVFRGSLGLKGGSSGNINKYTAYGSGAKPKLLGSLNRSSTINWIDEGSNVWRLKESLTGYNDIGNIIFNNEAFCGVKVFDAADMTSQNDFFYNEGDDTLRLYSVSNPGTFYSNIELATKLDVLRIYNNNYIDISNLDLRYGAIHGITIDKATNINIYDVDVSYMGGAKTTAGVRLGNGIQIWHDSSDIIVERCVINQIYDAGLTPQGANATYFQNDIIFRNNKISNCEYSYEFFGDKTADIHDIYFVNNVCTNAGSGWGHNQRPDEVRGTHVMLWTIPTSITNCTIKNNIFDQSTEQSIMWWFDTTVGDIDVNNNCYYESSGNVAKIGHHGMSYDYATQWSAYQTASGQDANSVVTNPQLDAEYKPHVNLFTPRLSTVLYDFKNDLRGNPTIIGALEPVLVADLSLVKTVNDMNPTTGDIVTFTLTVTNSGPNAATGVSVQDIIPSGFGNVTPLTAGANLNGSTLSWTGLTIANGADVVLELTAEVLITGTYINQAEITASDIVDFDSDPNTSFDTDDHNDGIVDDDESIIDNMVISLLSIGVDTDIIIVENDNNEFIDDNQLIFNMNLFPNPSSEKLNIHIENINKDSKLFINDLKGSIIYYDEITTNKTNLFSKVINLSGFSKGIYFVKVINQDINISKKIVII